MNRLKRTELLGSTMHRMKRVRRWISSAFAILSLAICVATSILWARSYRQLEMGTIERWHGVSMISFKGSMDLDFVTGSEKYWQYHEEVEDAVWARLGWRENTQPSTTEPANTQPEDTLRQMTEVDAEMGKMSPVNPPQVPLSDCLRFTWKAIPTRLIWNPKFPATHQGFGIHHDFHAQLLMDESYGDIFDDLSNDFPQTREFRGVTFPDWALILLTAIYPALIIGRKFFARRRTLAGHCAKCGYDLRATPDRCPECGTVSSSKKIIPAG